jgi:hypothetical protein
LKQVRLFIIFDVFSRQNCNTFDNQKNKTDEFKNLTNEELSIEYNKRNQACPFALVLYWNIYWYYG